MIGKMLALIVGLLLCLLGVGLIFSSLKPDENEENKSENGSGCLIAVVIWVIGALLISWSGLYVVGSVEDAFMRRP